MVRIVVGGRIGHGRGIENDDVGEGTGAKFAAVAKLEGFCGERGHFADGVFEGDDFLLAHVAAEDAGVVAVAARVRDGVAEAAHAGIGSDHREGLREEFFEVGFAHTVKHALGAAARLDFEDGLDLVVERVGPAEDLRGLRDGFSVEAFVGLKIGDDRVGVVAAFALRDGVFHFGDHAGLGGRIGETFLVTLGAAFAKFSGDQGRDASARSGVGVLIVGDREAGGAGLVEVGDDFIGAAPRDGAREFQVRNLGRNLGLAGDGGEFVEGGENAGALGTHVARVDAAMGRGDLGKSDDLVRFGESAGEINETGAEADRAILHGLSDQGAHLVEFGGGGWTGETAAHDLSAHGIVADECGHVDGDCGASDGVE